MIKTDRIICRLCLIPIKSTNFEVIENLFKEILEVVFIKLNLAVSEKPVICKDCEKRLLQSFSFKSMCLYAEDYITPFKDQQYGLKLDLKSIFFKGKAEICKNKNLKICRFCVDLLIDGFRLDEIEDPTLKNLLQEFIPEVDMHVVKDPVVCNMCLSSIDAHRNFMRKCIDTEEKICTYHKFKRSSYSRLVDLSDVMKSMLELKIEDKDDIKMFEVVEDTNYSTEKEIFLKNEIKSDNDNNFKVDVDTKESMFSINSQELNLERNTKGYLKCYLCLFETKRANALKRHVAIHSRAPTKLYKCKWCAATTNHRTAHNLHLLTHSGEPTPEIVYECDKCDFKTKHPSSLRVHSVKHVPKSELTIYTCYICGLKTSRKWYLKKHVTIHQDVSLVKIHQCQKCSFKTRYGNHLKRHMLLHADSNELIMYKCEKCNYQTKYKDSLTSHRVAHKERSELVMYKCNYCLYETKFKHRLNRHNVIHKDISEVEICCHWCRFRTKYKDSLKKHMRLHRDETCQMSYKCKICSFETFEKDYLKRHVIIHDNSRAKRFKCELCNYAAKQKNRLRLHIMIHQDFSKIAKIYQCQICVYKTKFCGDFNRHMRSHTDPSKLNMFKCSVCAYQSKYKQNLIRHLGKHRGITNMKKLNCKI